MISTVWISCMKRKKSTLLTTKLCWEKEEGLNWSRDASYNTRLTTTTTTVKTQPDPCVLCCVPSWRMVLWWSWCALLVAVIVAVKENTHMCVSLGCLLNFQFSEDGEKHRYKQVKEWEVGSKFLSSCGKARHRNFLYRCHVGVLVAGFLQV